MTTIQFASRCLDWFREYSPWIFGSFLPSVVIGLSKYPKAEGFSRVLKEILYFFSVLTHKDEQGTFKYPFVFQKGQGENPTKTAFLLLLLGSFGSCGAAGSAFWHNTANGLVDCSTVAVVKEVQNLMPAIDAIVRSESPNWDAQLKALESLGVGAVVCAVDAVIKNMTTSTLLRSTPGDFQTLERCQTYLRNALVQPKSVR